MASTGRWDRAAALPVATDGRRRAEIVGLAPGLPTVADLFTFMRDAELRFSTLRMRVEERTYTAVGELFAVSDVALRHPGHARVATSQPSRGTADRYEIWASDGATVRTYSAAHRLSTTRPVRNRPRGLDDRDFPGTAKVYEPLTALPMETLPDTFVHPAGYCQNVLATGRTWVSGTDSVGGREAIVLECDHPRTTEAAADRPDFHIQVAVDCAAGVVLRLTETIGGDVTRHAEVVSFQPDAPIPDSTFEDPLPADGTTLY